jgi:hypothetical protein
MPIVVREAYFLFSGKNNAQTGKNRAQIGENVQRGF